MANRETGIYGVILILTGCSVIGIATVITLNLENVFVLSCVYYFIISMLCAIAYLKINPSVTPIRRGIIVVCTAYVGIMIIMLILGFQNTYYESGMLVGLLLGGAAGGKYYMEETQK